MKYTVFDLESNGLLEKTIKAPEATKIYCVSYKVYDSKKLLFKGTLTDYDQIVNFLNSQEILIGHNIINYDIPLIEKLLKCKITTRLIDTLGVSWYLCPIKGFRHGLEFWGERLGIAKPKIEDWENLSLKKYIYRCEEDVSINSKLFINMMDYLFELYKDANKIDKLFKYLSFKMDCLKEQLLNKITLDVRLAEESKLNLEFILQEKIDLLSNLMPKELGKIVKNKPKVMYKKDESLSVHGSNWLKLLEELGLPDDTEVVREKPNPGSNKQLKEWLHLLGWKPQTFKKSKNTGEMLPQISLPFNQGLCPSIIDLIQEHPSLKELEDLYVVKHRYGIFKSYLENKNEQGLIHSSAQGFTNTLRLQHTKPIANLPGVDKYYGKEIRGCIKVKDDSYRMIGSDISGLEDSTKMHWMYFHDPEYVKQMQTPGFDGHTNIAVYVGMMTREDEDFFKHINELKKDKSFEFANEENKERYNQVSKIRKKAKPVNFGGQYGIGPAKLSVQLQVPLKEAQELHSGYWNLNWSIKKTAEEVPVRIVKGQKWIYNSISGFWMFLKEDKDKFSTLNQSSGVYVFDTWVKFVRKRLNPLGITILLQYHDEILLQFKKEHEEVVSYHLNEAMKEANKLLKLNVTIKISIDSGKNYAECH